MMLKETTMTKKTPWEPPKGIKEARLEIEDDNFELLVKYLELEVYPALLSQHEAICSIYKELELLRSGDIPLKDEGETLKKLFPPPKPTEVKESSMDDILDRLDLMEEKILEITSVLGDLVKFLER